MIEDLCYSTGLFFIQFGSGRGGVAMEAQYSAISIATPPRPFLEL